ncbi:hypothetical protein CANCADRAFT_1906 [Tortispora caseinolytica NRRL Y-17796]|uniref:Nudix hydrolase domain-containing protein n=1 Tax=Tortispora caseinolytica NRRL Y-17796 TaxID=767744 RepID=A0A1E4TEI7_9ASCO|nr:hypothetical protein CANCADRAFT_1906 [Tortispora caseinolytica NRRL Y-17796]
MDVERGLELIGKATYTELTEQCRHASVAIVLRKIQGTYEMLLIKRAMRKSDRWSGHVALPGGKRDPEDISDRDVAERETLEELGLDLKQYCEYIGALQPQRVVSSTASKPLMLLYPFVYLMTTPTDVRPSADEVAMSFWVPLTILIDLSARKDLRVSLTVRMKVSKWIKPLLHLLTGDMIFETVDVTSCAVDITYPIGQPASVDPLDLNLWGLTLYVLLGMLDFMAPRSIGSSTYLLPRLSHWDMRLVQLMRIRFRSPNINDAYPNLSQSEALEKCIFSIRSCANIAQCGRLAVILLIYALRK